MIHDLATLLSLGMTWPALAVCMLVLTSWYQQYIVYCKAVVKKPSMMLIAGVMIGFAGSMVDNFWWGLAWTADYIAPEHPVRDFLFLNGVYPNIFFRQGALIWAGMLHINPENMSRKTQVQTAMARKKTKAIILTSIIVGVIYIGILVILKT